MLNYSDDYEEQDADEVMVDRLVMAMGLALERASIKEVTSTADVLSALFTMLGRGLRHAQSQDGSSDDKVYNAKEIHRILAEFQLEFGSIRH